MEQKNNIAELLKDCPSGMELNCTSYDNVSFDKISDDKKATYPIFCYITDKEGNRSDISFTENGCESKRYGAKCVIFPKGKTTWEGFIPYCKFKDGDIVATENGSWIGITVGGVSNKFIPTYCIINSNNEFEAYFNIKETWHFNRLATEEEKEKLFQAIKDNGYHWNPETKTLEKLQEFKDGDIVTTEIGSIFIYNESLNNQDYFGCYVGLSCVNIKSKNPKIVIMDQFCFKNSDLRLATEEEKAKLFQTIKDNGYYWNAETKTLEKLVEPKFKVGDRIRHKTHIRQGNVVTEIKDTHYILDDGLALPFISQDEYELVLNKFDINTLVPFESRVLVRHTKDNKWCGCFFSFIDRDHHSYCYTFVTTAGKSYPMMIPYKGNEWLLGTTDDCNDFYKTWE